MKITKVKWDGGEKSQRYILESPCMKVVYSKFDKEYYLCRATEEGKTRGGIFIVEIEGQLDSLPRLMDYSKIEKLIGMIE